MKHTAISNLKVLLFGLCLCIIYSCGSQKDSATGRAMQNLTARYNYIYNSNLLLNTHQTELAENYADNYDQVLPAYLGPETDNTQASGSLNLKPMEDIIKKAQNIILEKSNSNYLDEAYILLGKAHFFNGNYFNATEYFDYTVKTYRKNTNSYLEALNWKARSMMQLQRINEANIVLDSLEAIIPAIKSKKRLAEPLATLAQMCIYLKNNAAAISYLKDAIKTSNESQRKIRWTYILAQLYESQKNYKEAVSCYRKVERSNATFEMYFNANLNQIKLKALTGGLKSNNQDELLSLLKDDKNLDYNDQIYFQVAESHALKEEYTDAEKFYLLSIQKSTTNPYQKGLSYLRIADLNFKQFRKYLTAKSYYDSTVNTLPKNYPGYDLILKKNQNLKYLTNRYEIIALQDTLRFISQQPEAGRTALIEGLASPASEAGQNNISTTATAYFPGSYNTAPGNRAQPQNSFYFSNPTAVSIGFNDFKKKWGSRKLENNWRQSVRSSAQETIQDVAANTSSTPASPDDELPVTNDKATLVKQYTEALPVTPDLLAQSNQKIIDAYYEIASFYLQELQDPKEAQTTYLTLLKRFPVNDHLAAIYYSLFLINKGTSESLSGEYKNKVLNEFPNSVYAKTILDPTFSAKQSERENLINKKYNEVFDQYTGKAFDQVIQQVNEQAKAGENYLSPQFAYLKAIATGRTGPVDPLLGALDTIVKQYPEDQLITPLAKDHLAYIKAHLEEFKKRAIALIDFDPNETPFTAGQTPETNIPPAATTAKTVVPPQKSPAPVPVIPKPEQKPTAKKQEETPPLTIPEKVGVPVTEPASPLAPAIKTDGTFSTASSGTYYYVIDVADASLTLSSSRFGIGQFNRAAYAGSNLKHQIKEFDNDQLIYVGNFSTFDEVKTYSSGITPQLRQIMKVPANIYTSFIISKENFDKLISKALLSQYIEFYKNNY